MTGTYANNGCNLAFELKSSGCAGTGGVCRSFSLKYSVAVSPSGKTLTGAVLVTVASATSSETCQATYSDSLVTP